MKELGGRLIISFINVSKIEVEQRDDKIKLSANSLFKEIFCFPTKYSSSNKNELLKA